MSPLDTKIPFETKPIRTTERVLGSGAIIKDTYLYPVFVHKRPTTPVIYNVATNSTTWVRVPATGTTLSKVLAWRLSLENGDQFDFAYVSSPTAYVTSYGVVQRDTEISAVYARLPAGGAATKYQLEVWG